jgi:DNA-directed RNA polymerase sigma subunit (sigma70/sigma32)
MFQQPPTNELVALMTAAPLADDSIHKEPYGPLFDIAEVVLTEDEFAVIQMLFGGNLSQRETGLLLARQKGRATAYSKTWVRKLRNRALQKLRDYATLRHASPHDFGDSE